MTDIMQMDGDTMGGRIQRGRDDVRVMVRYPQEQRRSLSDLDNLRIRTPGGAEVPFYAVADASLGRGFSTIKRADRKRVINVTSDLDESQISAGEILTDLNSGFMQKLLADYPGLNYGLEGIQAEQAESVGSLARDFGLALIVIYVLLAIPLRSYTQPFIIMAVIPMFFNLRILLSLEDISYIFFRSTIRWSTWLACCHTAANHRLTTGQRFLIDQVFLRALTSLCEDTPPEHCGKGQQVELGPILPREVALGQDRCKL